jgi:hypothetical protein
VLPPLVLGSLSLFLRLALIDTYLNGPRSLSNSRLSYLVVSQPPEDGLGIPTPPVTPHLSADATGDITRQYELLICAMHFIGDGMALHQFANDFFCLLGCEKTAPELELQLETEWRERWASNGNDVSSSNALNCPKRFDLLVMPHGRRPSFPVRSKIIFR